MAALGVPFRARTSSSGGTPRKSGFSRMAKGVLDARKEEPKSAIEAVVAYLIAPFCRSSATRELRQGIARAFVHMLRHIPRPDLERHSAFVLDQCLTALTVQVCSGVGGRKSSLWSGWVVGCGRRWEVEVHRVDATSARAVGQVPSGTLGRRRLRSLQLEQRVVGDSKERCQGGVQRFHSRQRKIPRPEVSASSAPTVVSRTLGRRRRVQRLRDAHSPCRPR